MMLVLKKICLVLLCLRSCLAQQNDKSDLGLGAYLPDYRMTYNVNASANHLTDLILFSIQPDQQGMINGCCLQKDHYNVASGARDHNNDLKIWVSIGGAGRSTGIPSITSDPVRRKRLIDESVRLCKEYDLHGIDLDAFYPTTLQQYKNYETFVRHASNVWHKNKIKLSVTWSLHRTPLPKSIFSLVDRINLMAYDLLTTQNTFHGAFELVEKSVETLIKQGCPPEKIWIGIPCYARGLKDPERVATFESIYNELLSLGDGKFDFEKTYSHNGLEWDSRERIREKVGYAHAKGLGGTFLWELGQDYQDQRKAPGGVLLEAASMHRKELLENSKSRTDEL